MASYVDHHRKCKVYYYITLQNDCPFFYIFCQEKFNYIFKKFDINYNFILGPQDAFSLNH